MPEDPSQVNGPADALGRALKRVGWRRHLLGARLALDRLPDKLLGIDTAGPVSYANLGFGPERGVNYVPSPWRALRRLVPRSEVTAEDVFVDFGCGKGRVLLQAARYPFRRVIGVELSQAVAEIARANVRRVQPFLRCPDVSIVIGDVVTYDIPDDVTVVYLYNPFSGSVFEALLARLTASANRRPRRIRAIYHNPTMHDLMIAAGWIEVDRRLLARADFPCDVATYVIDGRTTSR